MSRWSLHHRVALGVVVLVAFALLASGIVAVVLLRATLTAQIDSSLLSAAAQRGLGPPPIDRPVAATGDRQLPSAFVITRLDSGGAILFQVGGTLLQDIPGPDLTDFTAAKVASLDGAIVTVPGLRGGPAYRARALPAGDGGSAVLAVSLEPTDSTLRTFACWLLVIGLVVLGLTVVAAGWVVRMGLRPLEVVESTAEAIAAGDLSRRVPEGAPGTEVGRLSASLNGMLGQIEEAFAEREASEARLRRFVGDAGHELRTPLTSIRGYAELTRTGAMSSSQQQAIVLSRIENEAARMGVLVDELLLLARLDQQRPLERQPTDVAGVVADAVAAARARQPARPLEWAAPAHPVELIGDAFRLHQVLDNLLDNSLTHTPHSSAVVVTMSSDDATVTIGVGDGGPGMTPEQLDRAFDRFYRGDPARSRGGSGLGLSIVTAVVAAHGGSVACQSSVASGTTVTVSLPRSGEPAAARQRSSTA
ncbi:MAG: HAMP domain-containing histidine kinase [Actinomycetota bacterium]|nr:MAG: HAMP domain-containing histidine kinase [Actinomycetota bacterium]